MHRSRIGRRGMNYFTIKITDGPSTMQGFTIFMILFCIRAKVHRNVTNTADIYSYITNEFEHPKRDSRLAAYGGPVLQRFVLYREKQ